MSEPAAWRHEAKHNKSPSAEKNVKIHKIQQTCPFVPFLQTVWWWRTLLPTCRIALGNFNTLCDLNYYKIVNDIFRGPTHTTWCTGSIWQSAGLVKHE